MVYVDLVTKAEQYIHRSKIIAKRVCIIRACGHGMRVDNDT